MYRIKYFVRCSLALIMCVFILSMSVFSSYTGISTVLATGIDMPMTEAFTALYEVFLGIGSTVLLSTGVINDVEEITEIDVAQFGADFMEKKMGLSADTANIVIDALLPNAHDYYAQKYADAFVAYENGEMSLTDMKSYCPYGDNTLDIYIHGLFEDIWSSIGSFVDDVVSGTNDIALGSYIFSATDIQYTGDYEYINDTYYYRAYAPYGKSYYTLSDSSTEKICGVLTASENSVTGVIYYSVSFWYYDGAFKTLKMNVNETYPSYYSSGEDRIVEYSYSSIYGAGVMPSCNFPIFELDNSDDADWKLFLMGKTDDSACINKVTSFDFTNIFNGLSSTFNNIALKGTYKALDLYNALFGTLSNILNGTISDVNTYIDAVSSTLDDLVPDAGTDSNTGTDTNPNPSTDSTTVVKPADDSDILEWLKYIASILSMSWTFGSDIPDFLTGIGDYVKDIPDILIGLNDGFADVIDIGESTWEVVARVSDIIDKQSEALLDLISQGFIDVIDIDSSLAEKVAEISDLIDISNNNIISSSIDLGNSIVSSIDRVIADLQNIIASIIDYTGLLQLIIELLNNILSTIQEILDLFVGFFFIDFDAVKAHLLLALENIPEFTGLNAFMDIVMDMKDQISDSYDYPVIKMTTPDVLLSFLKSPEIVLIDFEYYAKYFIMVRTFLKFSLYFGFGLWIIRDIKVAFTLN